MSNLDAHWPAWNIHSDPAGLSRYVVPADVRILGAFPARASDARTDRLAAVWDVLRQRGISYAYEQEPAIRTANPQSVSLDDGQLIRPPAEVLTAPKSGTCLDLALILAGACVHAGLPACLIVVDPVTEGQPRHALVGVCLGRDWPEAMRGAAPPDVWTNAPEGFTDQILTDWDGPPRTVAVLDPIGISSGRKSSRTVGTAATLAEGVAAGHRYLTSGEWTWRFGVPALHRDDAWRPVAKPRVLPLRQIYRQIQTAESPLKLLRPEYRITPFQGRDEFTILQDFAERTLTGNRTGIAVLHGVGGAGKTRLALELAEHLTARGWYAGPLLDELDDPASITWLTSVRAPVMVLVDYADTRIAETKALLQTLKAREGPPAVAILTARTTEGNWLEQILGAQASGNHPYAIDDVGLPETHPRANGIYDTTYRAVLEQSSLSNESDVSIPEPPALKAPQAGRVWTTLDLVLLGWLAAKGRTDLPKSRADLYDEVLVHEQAYWGRAYRRITRDGEPDIALLARAGAALTLVSPVKEGSIDVLRAVSPLDEDAKWRSEVARAMNICLDNGPGQRIALRPDPVGDHHLLKTLTSNPGLLSRCVSKVPITNSLGGVVSKLPPAPGNESQPGNDADFNERLLQALLVLTRAAQDDSETATELVLGLLAQDLGRWRLILAVAQAVGGPSERALERAVRNGSDLPLKDLSEHVPHLATGVSRLGLLTDERRLSELSAESLEETAALLLAVSSRRRQIGDRAGALDAIDEAVKISRQLAQTNPAAFLPNLGAALNNQSIRRSDAGDRAGALTAINEAVTTYRQLAQVDPAAFLPNLGATLNNQSVQRSDSGDRAGTLTAIDEAVTTYRQLARTSPAAFLPDLAKALNNQSAVWSGARALAAIDEAVTIQRQLVQLNPAAFLPDLAMALNSQSIRRSDAGDMAGALTTIDEAVTTYRQLAQENPAAFLPNLAMSLNNQSNQRSSTGDLAGALTAIDEAVTTYRQLAQENPAAFLPNLAMALNNESAQRSDAGDRALALAEIDEAVTIYRSLVEANPAAFMPNLAMSLNNQSNRRSDGGDRAGALTAIDEAVTTYRHLAQADPAAFLPDLSAALNNQSNQRSGTGDRAGALKAIDEAVTIRRQLVQANPAAFLSDLAMSLNNQSNQRSDAGDRAGALTAIDEAATTYRQLAQANPAAFLPDLAMALNNQSVQRSEVGNMAGALTAINEAVTTYRQLAQANPAAFLPDLAMSLSNQSNRRSDAGDRAGALIAIDEAVSIYRQLAQAHPATFLPDLAMSLSNQSNERSGTGDRAGALTAIDEAVTTFRHLAQAHPATFLPDLAKALNNQSNERSGARDRAGALTAIDEAVTVRRQLVQANPAAFLPDLAMELNSQSIRRSDAGDLAGALTAIDEAVTTYRHLAQANPSAFLPDLAKALNNQSNQRSGTGDRAGALTAIDEAVTIRRQLAQANPATFLPSLLRSLWNWSDLHHGHDGFAKVHKMWFVVIESHVQPLARAELHASLADLAARRNQHGLARKEIASAIIEAAGDISSYPPHALIRARTSVRDVARSSAWPPDDLPAWAIADLPEEDTQFIASFTSAQSWLERDTAIVIYPPPFPGPNLERSTTILSFLNEGAADFDELVQFLALTREHGQEAILKAMREGSLRQELIDEWLGTPTWIESFRFLADHAEQLLEPSVIGQLNANYDPTAQQHAAILGLLDISPLDVIHRVVVDVEIATDQALAFLDSGDLLSVRQVVLASDQFALTPAGLLILAIFAALTDPEEQAQTSLMDCIEQSTATQRRAWIVRVQRLRAALESNDPTTNTAPLSGIIAALINAPE